jgi:protein CMS1
MIMGPGGDDLQDDLIINEPIASEEDESSPPVPGISQDSEESDALSNAAESALLFAKKRKRKAKDKERKAKVGSCGEYILYSSSLKLEAEAG